MNNAIVNTTQSQISFSDIGLIEAAPVSVPAAKRTKKVAVTNSAPLNSDVLAAFASLLAQSEIIAAALQTKYEANHKADRIQARVGISVDVEDAEALFEAISLANKLLNVAN